MQASSRTQRADGKETTSQTRFKKDIFYDEGTGTLEEVAQRGSRCPIPGDIHGQAGRGSQQPDPVEDISVYWGSTR